jgi:uncharacterized protein (UPF0335 family)
MTASSPCCPVPHANPARLSARLAHRVDNSGEAPEGAPGVNGKELLSFIERVERLHEERQAIADDIKDVLAEAKGKGYDPKAIKTLLGIRRQDADARHEHETIVELYARAIGQPL